MESMIPENTAKPAVKKYVLKIDMPENLGGEFSNSISTLKILEGNGCAKLYAYDIARKACFDE